MPHATTLKMTRRARKGHSSFSAIAVGAACLVLSATTASAQFGPADVHETGEQLARDGTLPDTDLTPRAKPAAFITQTAGAKFPTSDGADPAELVPGSPTAFDDDLYDVAMRGPHFGFAGGSRCATRPQRDEGESDWEFAERATRCAERDGTESVRVPIIYRYVDDPNTGESWERMELPGDDNSGYIGAIAFMNDGRAMAVGGTGTYPHREPNELEPSHESRVADDPAGAGRAWLFDHGRWAEVTEDLPAGARGMSALAFYTGPASIDLGFAGALGQLLEWRDDAFTTIYDRSTDTDKPAGQKRMLGGARFKFRVREIRFAESMNEPRALAVTSGCCADNPLHNAPSVLEYSESPGFGRWTAASPVTSDVTAADGEPIRYRQDLPDSIYAFTIGSGSNASTPSPGGLFTTRPYTFLLSSGGPETETEDPSGFLYSDLFCGIGGAGHLSVGTARFVGADGDSGGPGTVRRAFGRGCQGLGQRKFPPDGIPDWAVGELRSSRVEAIGARGLVLATHLPPRLAVTSPPSFGESVIEGETIDGPWASIGFEDGTASVGSHPSSDELASGWTPTTAERTSEYLASGAFSVPSYSLTAIDMIDTTGEGWAVGDRGGIVKVSEANLGGSVSAAEPEPPTLGAARKEDLPETDPYEHVRPALAREVGSVPALIHRPMDRLAEHTLVSSGAPAPTPSRDEPVEDISQIVMSRDGSEGWAVGPNARSIGPAAATDPATSLYHYRDGSWTRCAMDGIPGELPADPACAEVAGLLRTELDAPGGRVERSAKLFGIARVPFENDADPSNDDEFEAVAVGSQYRHRAGDPQRPVMIRYRDGRWRHEKVADRSEVEIASTRALQYVAFTAPDNGWALGGSNPTVGGGLGSAEVFHYDGHRWRRCALGAEGCGAGLPITVAGLVAAGERACMFGRRNTGGATYPMVLCREPGDDAWAGSPEVGGLDPGSGGGGDSSIRGRIFSLALSHGPEGYEGWAVGNFGGLSVSPGLIGDRDLLPRGTLLRLGPDGHWRGIGEEGPVGDYLFGREIATSTSPRHHATSPDGRAVVGQLMPGRLFGFDPQRSRWTIPTSDRPPDTSAGSGPHGYIQAVAPDNQGGFWVAVRNTPDNFWTNRGSSYPYFFHYTDTVRRPVFDETPYPLASQAAVTALSGGGDGSVWLGTDSSWIARYDRLTGWATVRVPGWDPGRIVTKSSPMHAIAVGESGIGVAVGKGGRIAHLSPRSVRLDPAAGKPCDPVPDPPCGTARDLRAAAVAPDGSAIVGGDNMAVLWRPADGEFRSVASPQAAAAANVTGASMPEPGVAYLTTDTGLLFRGELGMDEWRWRQENLRLDGRSLGRDAQGQPIPLRDIEVNSQGHGYAVGDRGLILERTDGSIRPWQRMETASRDDLTALALPAGHGNGALIGGYHGTVLTRTEDSFEVARPGDYAPGSIRGENDPAKAAARAQTGPVVGLALLPGFANGQVEAYAATGGAGRLRGRLLHYASEPAESLLNHGTAAIALPDAPQVAPGELAFAAFGKTECRRAISRADGCIEMLGTNSDFEVTSRRVVEEVASRANRPGGPAFAVFTGDSIDSPGPLGVGDTVERNRVDRTLPGRKFRRWREAVPDRLEERGVALFGALGAQELSETEVCDFDSCVTTHEHAKAGDNLFWRQAMADMAAPWGSGEVIETNGLRFEPIDDRGSAVRHEDQRVAVGVKNVPMSEAALGTGGASTHYAFDLIRDGIAVSRVVFVDNSLRSLAAADPVQQPLEPDGGQEGWLEAMLCMRGDVTEAGERCTREPRQQAIVVATTPTYSYGPGALTDTATDFATFERTLLRFDANVVVSGRLGWNGRYWATAPGLHEPLPGEDYRPDERAPDPGSSCATVVESDGPGHRVMEEADPTGVVDASGAIEEGEAGVSSLCGLLPFVIASSAGGKFGPNGDAEGSPADGFWRGYTVVRLHKSGDPAKTIVEQRPVYDWVSLSADVNVVLPRSTVPLKGIARGPIGVATANNFIGPIAAVDEISSPAITHRYDLVLADPEQPWLPCLASDPNCADIQSRLALGEGESAPVALGDDEPCVPYLCLPERIAEVDHQTGEVQAGNGRYPETFAIAILSVGDRVATKPLVFEPSPSFLIEPFEGMPQIPHGTNPKPPSVPNVPEPKIPALTLPTPPTLPAIPPLVAQAPPEPQPPAPPAPPPPAEQPSPLNLSVAPTGLTVATPTAVIQPPTPPVNPAPPGGARREARQRQAAAQKSGADNAEESGGEEGGGNDATDSRTVPATRRDRVKPEASSFTPLARTEQPSAWATGALYGGGVMLMALALAAGWSRGRPRPRPRPPDVPAAALARVRSRR